MPSDKIVKALIEKKLNRIVDITYLAPGYVHWDIRFFDVPKGEDDTRIVYNGTKKGINPIVWMPTFFLPTSASLGRLLEPGTY